MSRPVVDLIIPAFNEEASIAKVIAEVPKDWVRHIVVANNGSTDHTKTVAMQAGAIVVDQDLPGYGNACLKAIEYIDQHPPHPDIVAFVDGDYSDYPEQLPDLIKPIEEENVQLVIGSRALGQMQKGAMQSHQIFGNWLATSLIKLFYNYRFTDLGPFRAIRYETLKLIDMQDRNYGWTVEMQVKAAKHKLVCKEVPVRYRLRIGKSKVSGTIKGSVLAGVKILWIIFKSI